MRCRQFPHCTSIWQRSVGVATFPCRGQALKTLPLWYQPALNRKVTICCELCRPLEKLWRSQGDAETLVTLPLQGFRAVYFLVQDLCSWGVMHKVVFQQLAMQVAHIPMPFVPRMLVLTVTSSEQDLTRVFHRSSSWKAFAGHSSRTQRYLPLLAPNSSAPPSGARCAWQGCLLAVWFASWGSRSGDPRAVPATRGCVGRDAFMKFLG